MSAIARRLHEQLGALGMAGLVLLAGALAFFVLRVEPLETKSRLLEERLQEASRGALEATTSTRSGTADARLAAFYRFFDRPEPATDWLARLYAIGQALDVRLPAADYELIEDGERIARYRVTLPLSGTYAQIRAFLENALDQIPIMSLDQVTFRRTQANRPQVDAQVTLTLHLPKP